MTSLLSRFQQTFDSTENTEPDNNNLEVVEPVVSESSTNINSSPESSKYNAQNTLFIPFLGQSNAYHMSIVYESYQPENNVNNTSGALILQQNLSDFSNQNVIVSSTEESNFAIGGSKVNGNGYYLDDSYVWWYPDENRPGGALLQAEQRLGQWLSDNGAQPDDQIAIVWSQGESDVGDIVAQDPASKEAYKQSTLAVFDYLISNLGYSNITFYLVPTGRLQEEGASNAGLNSQEIAVMNEGIAIIQTAQSEIALERDDVQLAPNYSDLNMVYEEGQIYGESYDQNDSEWSEDFWHLGHDGLKVQGNRLAQYIALDQGQNNVISFTDSFGNPAQSISLTRNGILDLNIAETSSQEMIVGTNNPDLIVGSLAIEEIRGENGDDVIIATQGLDTLTGGNGNDVFFYPADAASIPGNQDIIIDFEPGRDRLDISEPLSSAGYSGSDPIADGYVIVNSLGDNSIEIQFDRDGMGAEPANTFAILENLDSLEFQENINNQFIYNPVEF